MCKEAGARLMAISIRRQDRFEERGSKEDMMEEMESRLNRLLNGNYIKGWKKEGVERNGAIVKSLLTL